MFPEFSDWTMKVGPSVTILMGQVKKKSANMRFACVRCSAYTGEHENSPNPLRGNDEFQV
jgi:hypothetical protein